LWDSNFRTDKELVMKTIVAILSLMSISSTVFAVENCGKEALEIIKMNLDSKAKVYGFAGSSINESLLKVVGQSSDGSIEYSVSGDIYKSQYSIRVGLDSSCSLEALKIKDISPR
jgi:hypothetical protein